MKIVILGGTGLIGGKLVNLLRSGGHLKLRGRELFQAREVRVRLDRGVAAVPGGPVGHIGLRGEPVEIAAKQFAGR